MFQINLISPIQPLLKAVYPVNRYKIASAGCYEKTPDYTNHIGKPTGNQSDIFPEWKYY
jgi:hypothetical protein